LTAESSLLVCWCVGVLVCWGVGVCVCVFCVEFLVTIFIAQRDIYFIVQHETTKKEGEIAEKETHQVPTNNKQATNKQINKQTKLK